MTDVNHNSTVDQAANMSLPSSPSCDPSVPSHGHLVRPIEEGADRHCSEVSAGYPSSGPRSTSERNSPERLTTRFGRKTLNVGAVSAVVHRPVRLEHSGQPSKVLDVCGEEGARTGALSNLAPRLHRKPSKCPPQMIPAEDEMSFLEEEFDVVDTMEMPPYHADAVPGSALDVAA